MVMSQACLFEELTAVKVAPSSFQISKSESDAFSRLLGSNQAQRIRVDRTPRCRICGCTEADPCRLPDGDTCLLAREGRNKYRCNGPKCAKARGQ